MNTPKLPPLPSAQYFQWGKPAMPVYQAHEMQTYATAATEPLLQRIAELEQRNRDLYEDVQRFRKHAMNEKATRMELERQLEESRKDADRWRTFLSTRPKATHDVINQAIDDAAMQRGQS